MWIQRMLNRREGEKTEFHQNERHEQKNMGHSQFITIINDQSITSDLTTIA